MRTLKIQKFAYLKTPLWSWTIENEVGGSFSNSGMHKSRKACMAQVTGQYPSEKFNLVELVDNGEEVSQ